ncbi:MAG: hypothetical protein GY853_15630 [PVC group bacterium]|nr:hypothetical protein [PVC group bacterium]
MECNLKVKGLESIDGIPITYNENIELTDFSGYIIPYHLIKLANPYSWIVAEVNGKDRKVIIYEIDGLVYMIDLLNGKKYNVN